MSWRFWTIVIMATTSLILISWDIIVAFFNDEDNDFDTESGIMQGWLKSGFWPIAWAWGVLAGHFFMPGLFWKMPSVFSISLLVFSGVLLWWLGWSFNSRLSKTKKAVAIRGCALLQIGIVEGWLLWPQ